MTMARSCRITKACCSDSWVVVKKGSTGVFVCLSLCMCVFMFAYVHVCEEAMVLGKRGVFFFHPVGPQAGVGRGGALGRRSMGRVVSAELSAL